MDHGITMFLAGLDLLDKTRRAEDGDPGDNRA